MRRRKAWLLVALGIALYCIFAVPPRLDGVGASASVVRAGIMGILMVLGPAFGRRSMALNALAVSALLMAVQSPFALWDVGFQLSFAATLALIVMATPLTSACQQFRAAALGQPSASQAEYTTDASDPPLGIISPTLGLRLDLGDGVTLEVVHTDDADGISLRLSYGTLSVYLDGDGDQPVTFDAPATVLRVGRHGDAKAATPVLLDALAASVAVISVSTSNRGSAPSDDTLARLAASGATIYRTDLNGTIRLTSDGERVWIETER